MKIFPRLILALALFALAARANGPMFSITPDDLLEDGYAFDIKVDQLKDGNVLFRIRIFGKNVDDENKKMLNRIFLSIHKEGSTTPIRTIVPEQGDRFLSCIFLVPEQSVEDPNFCFTFSPTSEEGMAFMGAPYFHVRLKDFWKADSVATSVNTGVAGGGAWGDPFGLKSVKARAETGYDNSAIMALGYRYQYGEGVPKDLVQAYKWFTLARVDSAVDRKARDEIAAKMTPAQIAEGERLAREFKPVALPPDKAPAAAGEQAPAVNQKN